MWHLDPDRRLSALVLILVCLPVTGVSQSTAPQAADANKQRLQQQARGPDGITTEAWDAEIQLAKMGDREQMERIVCELRYANNDRAQMEATIKLRLVGGYASIQELARVMHDNPKYNPSPPPAGGFILPLRDYALKELTVLLPQVIPPVFHNFPTMATEEQLRGWHEWIQQHHDEIYTPPLEVPDVSKKSCKALTKKWNKKPPVSGPSAR